MRRTTVRLNEALLEQAKREAGKRGETLTALIEQGLRLLLAQSRQPQRRKKIVLPVSKASGGTQPGVDITDSARLLDILEDRE
jgi:hypothetical protein